MRSRYLIGVVVLIALLGFGLGRLSAATGTLDSPAPPALTSSYSLEDIYNRLDSGVAGTPGTFAEPAGGSTVGTGHTLSQTMALAPAADNVNGATETQVLSSMIFWSLRTSGGSWGLLTGTMPNNGAATIVPVTTTQAIPAGYHNGSGFVAGDADLVASSIVSSVNIFGVTGVYTLAPVPKTGQTVSYAAGDDGDLEKGVAWPDPRFTNNGDGTVTDNLTGLIWLQNANCATTSRSWSDALSEVALLNTSGWMGIGVYPDYDCGDTSNGGSHQTDWRLPSVRELQSLIDYSGTIYTLPIPNPFSSVALSSYWSSTTMSDPAWPNTAWYVHMGTALTSFSSKADGRYVWPVRGGQ